VTLFQTTVATALLACALMSIIWLIQMRTGDAGIVDVVWSGALGIAAVVAAVWSSGHPTRRVIVGVIAGVWSVRLTIYLFVDRILRAENEDGRYRMLREQWGPSAQPWLFVFFQGQAFFVVAFSVPFFVAAGNQQPIGWYDYAAIAMWVISIAGESLADRQLSAHRSRPENRGQTCRTGLWAYSRHPNYFFEWLHWWSYVLLSLGAAYWWLSPAAAVFMLFLLFYVTGIPYTEKRALATRGNDYRDYQRTTSVFVPWFPKGEQPT